MTAHPVVIEAGPGTVRRLCCGTGKPANIELAAAALDGIDDTVTLVDEQPVAVAALWDSVLEALACPKGQSTPESVLIVYPSWWSASRVGVVAAAAARTLAENVVTRARAELLAAAAPDTGTKVVVEIAPRLVAITAAATIAEPRSGPADLMAEAVARRIIALSHGVAAAVLIDGPDSVSGAVALAAMIAERLRTEAPDAHAQLIDDARFVRLAAPASPAKTESPPHEPADLGSRQCRRLPALASALVLGVAAVGAGIWSRHDPAAVDVAVDAVRMTFLVEGRVALQVPAQWPVQRVTGGPGSARVEVISPADPQVVLHVTQSPVPVATLSATAETLQRALERANADESADVFVGFNPAGQRAGRPAVTYREVREGHHIDWTVLVDGAVRISIGCQSRPDGADAIRAVCEQAVRSARAVR
jgi:type VII secretion-associated protein (TIGR03931 family)